MTTFLGVKNNAESLLAADITAAATSLTVTTGDGAKFPTSNFPVSIDDEIMLCSSRTGDVLTVTRAQEGTTAAAHVAGVAVRLNITAGIIGELQAACIDKSCGVVSNASNTCTVSGNYYTLAYGSELWDTDNIHDNSTNNSRLTCKTTGLYLIIAWVKWDPNATGRRYLIINLNGSTTVTAINQMAITDSGGYTQQTIVGLYNLIVNDYIEVQVMQASGVSLDIASGNTKFYMARIA